MVFFSLDFYQPSLWILYFFTYIGILTSILNHGFSHWSAKIADRTMMCILVVVYVYYVFWIQTIRQKLTLSILAFCILAFFVSKVRHLEPFFETVQRFSLEAPFSEYFTFSNKTLSENRVFVNSAEYNQLNDPFYYNPYIAYTACYNTLSTHIHTITHILSTLTFLFIVSNV